MNISLLCYFNHDKNFGNFKKKNHLIKNNL